MKSKVIKQLMRALILLVGASAGLTLAFLCVQVHEMTNDDPVSLWLLVVLYLGMGTLGGLCGHLVAPKVTAWWSKCMSAVERRLDDLSAVQLFSMAMWFIGGLLAAALITQVLHFLGESMFTMTISAILYVVLGILGMTIGMRRADDFATLLINRPHIRRSGKAAPVKVLDASVLMDGRIASVIRTGVIEGELLTADFILAELQEMAASSDAAKRLRGQRGLDTVKALKTSPAPLQTEDSDGPVPLESDVALMSLAREKNATLLTADAMMHKAARVAGLPVINLNDLALALRSVTSAGDVLSVRLSKEGKEAHQTVGYLDDGTMLVVENSREHLGETVSVTVTSVLQTSAGRMAFARLND